MKTRRTTRARHREALVVAVMLLAACRAATPGVPAQLATSGAHLSPAERDRLAVIQRIHEPGLGLIQRLRESGRVASNVEWWVAGDSTVLPFAGTWRGVDGVAAFQQQLGASMRYQKVELREYLPSGDHVAVIFMGEGVGRATGRPFRGEIVRLYTFAGDSIVRVRNFYDTAEYASALRAVP